MILAGFTDEAAVDIEGQVRALEELGWNSMEIRAVDNISIHDIDERSFDHVRKTLEEHEITVCCLGSTIANWGQSIHEPFAKTREAVQRAIRRMRILHVPLVRIMSYAVEVGPDGRAEADQHEEKRFSRLRDICAMFTDADITPVHENCFTYGGMSYKHTLRLLDEVPSLKLVYDTGNPPLTPDFTKDFPYPHQDAWEYYRHVRDDIVHVHIKDARYDAERKRELYCFPTEGDGQVMRIVSDLLAHGYDRAFSIEPHMAVVFHDESVTSDPEARFKNFITYGRKFEELLKEAKRQAASKS